MTVKINNGIKYNNENNIASNKYTKIEIIIIDIINNNNNNKW